MKKIYAWIVMLGLSVGLTACTNEKVEEQEVISESNEEVNLQAENTEEVVVDYEGSLWLKEQKYRYMATREDGTLDYHILIQNVNEETVQEINYSYDLQGDTAVLAGIEPKDVNQDGYDDILILLGGHGNIGALWACYVFDEAVGQYIYIEGFEELLGVEIDEEIRSFYYGGGGSYYRLERYAIENNTLLLEGRLTQELREQDFGPYISCMEEHYEDGKIVYSKRNIQVSEIDMDFWNHDIGQGLELEPMISDNSGNPYVEILDFYYQALFERQTSQEPELDQYYEDYNLIYSILAPYWAWESSENILSKGGFAFLDLNDDGVEELLLGWVGNEFWNMDEGYVFAVYTIVDGKAILAIEGWERCLYVIGKDGYLYKSGTSSAWEGNYTKYRFNPEYEDFLEPVEEIYSYMDAKGEVCWKHKTNPLEAGGAESLDSEEAQSMGEGWMTSGMKLDYTLFSEYEQIQ